MEKKAQPIKTNPEIKDIRITHKKIKIVIITIYLSPKKKRDKEY